MSTQNKQSPALRCGRLVRRLECINCGKRAALARGPLGGWTVSPACECNPAAQIEVGCTRSKAMDYFSPNGRGETRRGE